MSYSGVRGASEAFDSAYSSVSGHGLSSKDRASLPKDPSFTYGEVKLDSFWELLSRARPEEGEVFCDLGAGTGKAVQAASLSGVGFRKCVGVELLPGLHAASVEADSAVREALPGGAAGLPEVDLLLGDMRVVDWWSEADVVYTSSICFGPDLWDQLQPRFRAMKAGSRVLTLKPLDTTSGHFSELESMETSMTWGSIRVRLYRRTDKPSSA